MTESSPDYSQISGFYGRGTGAAWAITLFASWIPIWRNDWKYNLHYHSYALYTNWAAIDLLRQMWRADLHGSFREMENAHLQSFFAALAVVRVGLFHAYLQIQSCRSALRDKDAATGLDIRERKRCILIGLLLPFFVSTLVLPFFHNKMADHGWFGWFGGLSYTALTAVAVTIGFIMSGWVMLCWDNEDHLLGSSFNFYTSLYLLLPYLVWGTFGHSEIVAENLCSVIPCAPQAIGEWDQAFSLVVALFFFFYEFGNGAVQSMRAFQRRAVEERNQTLN